MKVKTKVRCGVCEVLVDALNFVPSREERQDVAVVRCSQNVGDGEGDQRDGEFQLITSVTSTLSDWRTSTFGAVCIEGRVRTRRVLLGDGNAVVHHERLAKCRGAKMKTTI